MRLLLIVVALTLALPGCTMLGVESQKRNQLWEQYTAEGHSAERHHKLDVAEAKYREALDMTTAFHKSDPRRCMTALSLADVLQLEGKDAEAKQLYEEALAWYEAWSKTVKEDEALNRGGRQVAAGYLGLATIHERQGNLQLAKENFKKSRDFSMCAFAGSRVFKSANDGYIRMLEATGEKAEAEKVRSRSSDAVVASLTNPKPGPSYEETANKSLKLMQEEVTKYGATSERGLAASVNAIQYLRNREQYEAALKMTDELLNNPELHDKHFRAMLLNMRASCLIGTKRDAAGLESAKQALAVATELNENEEIAAARYHIGLAQSKDPKTRDEAIENLRAAWDVQKDYNVDPMFWHNSLELARLYADKGSLSEAHAVLNESILAQTERESLIMRDTLLAMAAVCSRENKPEEAARYEKKAANLTQIVEERERQRKKRSRDSS